MYALQGSQCNPRNHLPQVRLPEPAPQEQGKKGVTVFINIFSGFKLNNM
jgi:saccharopine dehydrogenase-like NADP-dependent oxidoreductase